MMETLISWFLASKSAKIGASVGAGGGVIALILGLHQDIKLEIVETERRAKIYSELQSQSVKQEFGAKLDHLKDGQNELKTLVKTIDQRLYDLKRSE